MAKTAIVSGANPCHISRGDDPPYPPVSGWRPMAKTAIVSGANPCYISRGDDPRTRCPLGGDLPYSAVLSPVRAPILRCYLPEDAPPNLPADDPRTPGDRGRA